jgi:hypothetical protein
VAIFTGSTITAPALFIAGDPFLDDTVDASLVPKIVASDADARALEPAGSRRGV